MPPITDPITDAAKILAIGESGAGKTGSLASLVAAGYKLRIIDTDKGVKTLRSLLTDPRYPYRPFCEAKGIDIGAAVHFMPIDTEMAMRAVEKKMGDKVVRETLLAPKSAKGWNKVIDLLTEWKDGDINYGPITSWEPDTVLVIDSLSTLARCAYYFNQMLNGRLGARDEGFDYQRDIGGAQSQLTRLLEMLYDSSVRCNVIVISHITWVDTSKGYASSPKPSMENKSDGATPMESLSTPDGYPSAIGRALSPQIGKYFNDTYVYRSSGSGTAVRRTISTVPTGGVLAKNSVFLDREYPVSTGLAEIFAAQHGQTRPLELIKALQAAPTKTLSVQAAPGATADAVR